MVEARLRPPPSLAPAASRGRLRPSPWVGRALPHPIPAQRPPGTPFDRFPGRGCTAAVTTEPADETPHLLRRWHEGDREALERLVALHLPWLRGHVHTRLGPFLRERGEVADYLQDVLLEFLRDGPRFLVADGRQFRRLLMRVAENTLRDKNDWYRAQRRHLAAGAQVSPSDSLLDLQSGLVVSSTPSRALQREETKAWVRLALELLEPDARKVIVERDYAGKSFVQIGEELGMSGDAVRMRWTRAVAALADTLRSLQAGDFGREGGSP